MAFYEETEGGSGNYLKIIDGSICRKSSTERDGFEEFNTENPTTGAAVRYWIKRYKAVEGYVRSLERVELTNSKIYGWNLHMEDEDGKFSIFFKEDSRTTDRLLKVFENIDLEIPLTISVWKDEDGKAAIDFRQNKVGVPQKWNKDNLPEPKKIKGKWNYDNVGEFLYNNAMENIIPQFAVKTEEPATAEAVTEEDPY